MKKEIFTKLKSIEHDHSVTVLFAVESGSRAWGFESRDSDYDVRFVYKHEHDWYLSLDERRDVIEYPLEGMLDFSGWDIRKALKKYFYVLRPVIACEWIRLNKTPPPMEFEKLMQEMITDIKLKEKIANLLIRKTAGDELSEEPAIPIINEYLEDRISFYENCADRLPRNSIELDFLNELFKKTVAS